MILNILTITKKLADFAKLSTIDLEESVKVMKFK
jgi:hypothetical protein